jgi:hypothetical protein
MSVHDDQVRKEIVRILGNAKQVDGAEHNYACPACIRAKRRHIGTMHVNYAKDKALCHSCTKGFKTLKSFVLWLGGSLTEQVRYGEDYVESMEEKLWGTETAAAAETKVVEAVVHMPETFREFSDGDPANRMESVVRAYLDKRGVTADVRKELGAGYCTKGELRGYAVFPIYMHGVLSSWTSRRVVGFGPKILHESDIASRGLLFNYDRCRRARRIFITEGPFDALAMHGRLRRRDGGVGALGTALQAGKIALLESLPCAEEYVVLLDNDAWEKAMKIAQALLNHTEGRAVRAVYLPDARDPDEIGDEEIGQIIDATPLFDPAMSALALLHG